MSAVADHQGLSHRGKNRTQNKCPNEEMNKKTKTNVHIGTLDKTIYTDRSKQNIMVLRTYKSR